MYHHYTVICRLTLAKMLNCCDVVSLRVNEECPYVCRLGLYSRGNGGGAPSVLLHQLQSTPQLASLNLRGPFALPLTVGPMGSLMCMFTDWSIAACARLCVRSAFGMCRLSGGKSTEFPASLAACLTKQVILLILNKGLSAL